MGCVWVHHPSCLIYRSILWFTYTKKHPASWACGEYHLGKSLALSSPCVPEEVWRRIPLIISTMPRQFGPSPVPAEDEIGAWITKEIDRIMDEYLVQEGERGCWAKRGEQDLSTALLACLDELIIRQTATLGYWMEHSGVVQGRIRAWEVMSHGDELFRRYNVARDKQMRHLHRRGGVLPPIDPGLKQFKKATVSELRIVLEDLRGHFAAFRRKVKQAELLDRFRHTIGQNGCAYLQGNQLSWAGFLTAQTRRHPVESLLKRTPASLFDEWVAWATTYKLEVLRQKISRQKL